MKIRLSLSVIALILVLCLTLAVTPGCNKSNTSGINATTSTISTILKAATNATYFYYAMTRTGMDSVLNGTGPFTVFVPTDSAFENSGITISHLIAMTDSALRRLVLYETIGANLPSTSVSGPNQKIITANGDSVFLTNNANGFYINGIPVEQADIVAKNGIIQAISNAVTFPPLGNLLHIIQTDTAYVFLSAALNRASMGTTDLNTMLTSGGPYTLFAPNNLAFQTNGYPDTTTINAANPDSLARILLYHIVPARMFTSDISSGQKSITLMDSTILFSSSGSTRQVVGNSNDVPANVLVSNTMGYNGVLYKIDEVLMP
ncbi:MAG: fasciclin domain-containing protein [Chitinophagales bacterium]